MARARLKPRGSARLRVQRADHSATLPFRILHSLSFFFSFFKVFFQDVFAEAEGSHSIDGVWRTSFRAFVLTKYWCYRIITAVCGVPTAILCGIYFACLSFNYIWFVIPCLRAYTIELQFFGKLFRLCVRSFFDPFFESVGKIFGGVKIEQKTIPV